MNPENNINININLQDEEEIIESTFEELSNGKGDDE